MVRRGGKTEDHTIGPKSGGPIAVKTKRVQKVLNYAKVDVGHSYVGIEIHVKYIYPNQRKRGAELASKKTR